MYGQAVCDNGYNSDMESSPSFASNLQRLQANQVTSAPPETNRKRLVF